MTYTWPLNDNHYSLWDRMKIAYFILNPDNRWTSGPQVLEFERYWAQATGYKYALMTSSGSTAVEIMARLWKRKYQTYDQRRIFFPALTWPTSVTPWIEAGFEPEFIDVNEFMCMDAFLVQQAAERMHSGRVCGAFPTSTLGAYPWVSSMKVTCGNVAVDNCEAHHRIGISNRDMVPCVTSFYFGHHFTTGTEGGMVFLNDEDEFKTAIALRAHGLNREQEKYFDVEAGGKFEFDVMGSNFRSSDLAAYMGNLNSKRVVSSLKHRSILYETFKRNIHSSYETFGLDSAFAIPIVNTTIDKNEVMDLLESMGIETRPIIGGNLLRHKAFSTYGEAEKYPVADHFHNYGFYVGLHEGVTEGDVERLTEVLNEIVR